MPQSVAIAIAEGNLDPISMEAFDHSPSTRFRSNPVRIESSGRVPRVEAPLVAAKESCFVAFSSKKSRENSVITVSEEEKKHHSKVEALQKLIMTSMVHSANEMTSEVTSTPLKVPNNNPFKRQKPDQNHSEQVKDLIIDSDTISYENTSQKVPEDGASRKRKLEEMNLDQRESVVEEISWVTKEEKSDIMCVNFESQESVNSKAVNRITGEGKRKGKNEKLKITNTKSSGNKNSSILNFFSRV